MNDIQILTGIIPDNIINALSPEFLLKAEIDGPMRLSHFLGQLMTESGNFKKLVENLNYSAERLIIVFPHRFRDLDEAKLFENKPEEIANRIYSRIDLGNTSPGDGWKYRGHGPLQLTGKNAYKKFQDWVNEDIATPINIIDQPDIVSNDIKVGLMSAVWFFSVEKRLWAICDEGVDMQTVESVTKKVNGGVNGLQDRYKHTQAIYTALTI